MNPLRVTATVALLALGAISASAQPILSAKSGVIAGVEGKVLIDGQEVQQSVTHFPEVKEGSVLTTQDGRVELMLPPGFMLRMGENGAVKMLGNRLIDTRVELQSGSAVLEVDQTKEDYSVNVAVKDSIVMLSKVGVYRFDSNPATVRVFHGSASVQINGEIVMIGTGRQMSLEPGSKGVQKFDVEQTDALDNWSRRRAEAMALANISGAKYAGDNYSRSGGNGWMYNPYFDMYTYIPMTGRMCNPFYGMCYYSPTLAYQMFYINPMIYGYVPNIGGRSGVGTTAPLRSTSIGSAASNPAAAMANSGSIGSRSGSYSGMSSTPVSSVGISGGGMGGGGISSGGGGGGGISSGISAGPAGGAHAGGGPAAGVAAAGGAHGK